MATTFISPSEKGWPVDDSGHHIPGAFYEDVTTERECPRFVEWIRGYSPKEHREMKLVNEVLAAERFERAKERREDRFFNLLCSLLGSGALVFILEWYVFPKR